jgi:hypothetical protein
MVVAAGLTRCPLVAAEKYVVFEETHLNLLKGELNTEAPG